jgi:hypothetical protein
LLASGKNNRRRRGLVALVATIAALAALLGAASASADPTPEAAVAELNAWRAQIGLTPLSTTTVSAWNTGCAHANNYGFQNKELTHNEMGGHGGYTSDGADAAANSVLSNYFSAPDPVSDAALLPGPTWDSGVFHRAALLQPRLAQTGFASSTFLEGSLWQSFTCMRTLGGAIDDSHTTPGLTLYPSPGNGAYNVPTVFPAGSEFPDPAKEDGVPAGSTLGWLLNVEINGPWSTAGFGYQANAHGVTATLAPDGTSNFVPLVVSQCGPSGCGGGGGTSDGIYFGGGFGIFPTQPLAPDTTYRVVLTGGVVTDQTTHVDYPIPAGYSWCFSTGATYAESDDCGPPTAAEEPTHPNASSAFSFTPKKPTGGSSGGEGGGSTGGSSSSKGGSTSGGTKGGPVKRPARCVVPNLAGKKLKAAHKKLRAAGCKLGKVTKQDGAKAKSAKVVKQGAKPGSHLPAGAKIAVTIAKG